MEMNNLFVYSPKELATDGFLNWFIISLQDDQESLYALFTGLGLCEKGVKVIDNIEISRQEQNTDLIIRYHLDGVPHQALFENKLYTTEHSDQLKRYKEAFPDFSYYKFLKLDRINYSERRYAKEQGYDVLTACDLYQAISSTGAEGEIVNQYKEYLEKCYLDRLLNLSSNLLEHNRHDLLAERYAQHFIIDHLYEGIDGKNDALYFKTASNQGGSPWTQLDIVCRENAYGDQNEYLFWRIDKRAGKHYIRLNQYAYVSDEHADIKWKNLEQLREVIEPLFIKHGLTVGKVSNAGMKESEVCIVFFPDNTVKDVIDAIIPLTQDVVSAYQSMEFITES